MAKRDVVKYFLEMEEQLHELENDVKDLDECWKNGTLTEEQFNASIDYINKIKNNYDRLSYVLFLLDKPVRKNKTSKYLNKNKLVLNYVQLNKATDEDVINENNDALKNLRKFLKETQDKHE